MRSGTGWYDVNGIWHDQDPRGDQSPQQPILIARPQGGTFNAGETINVNLTVSNNVTSIIHYTLDGSTPSNVSPVFNGAIAINQNTW